MTYSFTVSSSSQITCSDLLNSFTSFAKNSNDYDKSITQNFKFRIEDKTNTPVKVKVSISNNTVYTLITSNDEQNITKRFLHDYLDSTYNTYGFLLLDTIEVRTETLTPTHHLKLGGIASPYPIESVYIYSVNNNHPLPTVRSGGSTYLPAGESLHTYEVSMTFSGYENIDVPPALINELVFDLEQTRFFKAMIVLRSRSRRS